MENTLLTPKLRKKREKKAISPLHVVLKTLAVLFLAVLCVLFLFPVWWMVISSFKTEDMIYAQMDSWQTFLPGTWNVADWFVSYQKLFSSFEYFGQSILNSIVYCSVTIAAVLLVNSFAGYALARLEFPGSRTLTTVIILLIIVPVETSIVPQYVILSKLGLLSTDLRVVGYLLPGFVSAFYIFMFRQFYLGMPRSWKRRRK